MTHYHQDNPGRIVSWRWERARMLREGYMRGTSRRNEDEWVLAALKFQQALNRCHDDLGRYTVMERNPSLYYAWTATRPVGDDDRGNPLRWALEARLLAGESKEQIANKLGCNSDMVFWYEKLFFNVSDKLQNPDYIMTCVIGPSVHAGLTAQEYDILWKVFGYLYGPVMLDAFVHGTSARRKAETADEADILLSGDVQSAVRRKAAICARVYTLNNFTQEGLMNIYARFLELERATDAGVAKDTFLSTVSVVLNAMPFADGAGSIRPDQIGNDGPKLLKIDHPQLEHYDNVNAELRTDELLAVTAGRDVPNRADLESMKFPEPQDANLS